MPKFPLFKTLIEQLRMPAVSVGESTTCESCGASGATMTTEGTLMCAKCMKGKKLSEREMSGSEKSERERLVKGMKKSAGDFEKRYPGRGKDVMYATATKRAMGEADLLSAPLEEEGGLTDDEHSKLDKIISLIDQGKIVMGVSKQKLEAEHGDSWKSAAYGIISQKLVDARPGGDPVEPPQDKEPMSDEPRMESRRVHKKKYKHV